MPRARPRSTQSWLGLRGKRQREDLRLGAGGPDAASRVGQTPASPHSAQCCVGPLRARRTSKATADGNVLVVCEPSPLVPAPSPVRSSRPGRRSPTPKPPALCPPRTPRPQLLGPATSWAMACPAPCGPQLLVPRSTCPCTDSFQCGLRVCPYCLGCNLLLSLFVPELSTIWPLVS